MSLKHSGPSERLECTPVTAKWWSKRTTTRQVSTARRIEILHTRTKPSFRSMTESGACVTWHFRPESTLKVELLAAGWSDQRFPAPDLRYCWIAHVIAWCIFFMSWHRLHQGRSWSLLAAFSTCQSLRGIVWTPMVVGKHWLINSRLRRWTVGTY